MESPTESQDNYPCVHPMLYREYFFGAGHSPYPGVYPSIRCKLCGMVRNGRSQGAVGFINERHEWIKQCLAKLARMQGDFEFLLKLDSPRFSRYHNPDWMKDRFVQE
jgi:hypothetical protein